jgi:hypothetical protein
MMRFLYVRYCTLYRYGTTGGIQQMGRTPYQKMVAVHGSPCAPTTLILVLVGHVTCTWRSHTHMLLVSLSYVQQSICAPLLNETGFIKPWYTYHQWDASHCSVVHRHSKKTRSSGKNSFAYIPYVSHLFELLEPNSIKINLSELALTSINAI